MDFYVESEYLVDCQSYGNSAGSQDNACVDYVLLVVPESHREEEEKVERTDHLLQQDLIPSWPLNFNGSFAVVPSELLYLVV